MKMKKGLESIIFLLSLSTASGAFAYGTQQKICTHWGNCFVAAPVNLAQNDYRYPRYSYPQSNRNNYNRYNTSNYSQYDSYSRNPRYNYASYYSSQYGYGPRYAARSYQPQSQYGYFQNQYGRVWRDQYNDRPALPRQFGAGEKVFVFSPKYRQWAAYESTGNLIGYGRANGGADYCPELGKRCHTPQGTFRVNSKGAPTCRSHKFPLGVGGAEMPYCMFFGGSGYAIHGSPYISTNNGSHGCIRVTTTAAQWLSHEFINTGTKVVVLPYE